MIGHFISAIIFLGPHQPTTRTLLSCSWSRICLAYASRKQLWANDRAASIVHAAGSAGLIEAFRLKDAVSTTLSPAVGAMGMA